MQCSSLSMATRDIVCILVCLSYRRRINNAAEILTKRDWVYVCDRVCECGCLNEDIKFSECYVSISLYAHTHNPTFDSRELFAQLFNICIISYRLTNGNSHTDIHILSSHLNMVIIHMWSETDS